MRKKQVLHSSLLMLMSVSVASADDDAKTYVEVYAPTYDAPRLELSNSSQSKNGKYIENGRVIIVKNGKKYKLNGQAFNEN